MLTYFDLILLILTNVDLFDLILLILTNFDLFDLFWHILTHFELQFLPYKIQHQELHIKELNTLYIPAEIL